MYQIYTDKHIGRVEIRFDTVLNRSLVGFDESLRLACLMNYRLVGYFDLLVDYTHSGEMSGNVLADARQRVEWCLTNGLRKSANITTDADLAAQIDSLSPSPERIRTFDNRNDAVAWLENAQIIPFPKKPV